MPTAQKSGRKKARRMTEEEKMEQARTQLRRVVSGQSMANWGPIFDGFTAMGIAEDDIRPRENVFPYNAWKALGRQVRRGEHGVKVTTMIERENSDGTGEVVKFPTSATVFHVSQTDPIEGGSEGTKEIQPQ